MLRNLLFSIIFFSGIFFISIIFLPALILPQRVVLAGGKLMGYWTSFCLRIILSVKIQILGNLKFCEAKKINSSKVIYNNFFSRKILCAASTHNNEEEIISNIHLNLKKKINNLLTVIIPRHAERTKEILNMLKYKKLNYICHSESKKIRKNTDIYLVDTYGVSRTFYSISKVVFLGGSFIPRGGQNPLEAVRYGCYITHGLSLIHI